MSNLTKYQLVCNACGQDSYVLLPPDSDDPKYCPCCAAPLDDEQSEPPAVEGEPD